MIGIKSKMCYCVFFSVLIILFAFINIEDFTCVANSSYDYAYYVKSLVGTDAKEWGDAGESTQCVELVKYYVEQICGVRTRDKALGNGNNIYKRVAQEYPQYFTSIDYYDGMVLMPGDIVSYNSNGWAIDYGHTAIVYEVLGNDYMIAEQWQYSGFVHSNTKKIIHGQYGVPYSIIGIARPNNNVNPTIPGKPNPQVDLFAFEVGDVVNITWNNVANVSSYWLHIYKNGEDYINKDIGNVLSYSEEFPVGEYTAYIVPYNSFGETLSYVNFVVYDSKPKYANVELSLNAYEVGDDVTFYLSSDTGNNYTVGIDDADGNRIDTYNTDFLENTYTRTFDTPGQYSCYISTYNNFGQADSERIYFTIYVKGDVNDDDVFNIADAVLLQKWLLAVPETHLANWKAADLCEDGKIDVFDLCMIKHMLING